MLFSEIFPYLGVTGYATARIHSLEDSFLVFFPPHIEKIILENTNKFGREFGGENHFDVDADLLHAYFAVLILAGVYK